MIRNGLILGLVLALGLIVLIGPPSSAEGPPPPPTKIPVNKHVLIEYRDDVQISRHDAPPGLLGALDPIGINQEFVIQLRGTVPAGFDLLDHAPDQWISVDGTEVQYILPLPEIFEDDVHMDTLNSDIVAESDRCPNFLCPTSLLHGLLEEAVPNGKAMLVDSARRHGIIDDAAEEGRKYYQTYLCSLGFEEVTVVVTGYGSSPITCRTEQD